MNIFEKAKATISEDDISADEIYYGIGFIYYSEIITRDEYCALMEVFKKNHPGYMEE